MSNAAPRVGFDKSPSAENQNDVNSASPRKPARYDVPYRPASFLSINIAARL
jgi:hypothetical protein